MKTYEQHEQDTQEVLVEIGKMLDRYMIFPNREGRDAVCLWVAHTWVFDHFEATPRLSIFSTEYGSGKSRLMDLVCGMSPDTMSTVNARPSMIYGAIEDREKVVISIDEIDMIFGKRGSGQSHKALQAILNEGFTSEGVTQSGSPGNYRTLSLFTPIVTAGKGMVPDALKTRSIRVPVRKAPDGAKLEDYRIKKVRFQYAQVKRLLDKWSRSSGSALEFCDPDIPFRNRDADKWEPLFAIAELAGGDWPKRVSRAARLLERDDAGEEVPMSVRMIRDIETFIEEHELTEGDNVHTRDLVAGLIDLGWDERFARPRPIAKQLDVYGIDPENVRAYTYSVGGERSSKKTVASGYKVADLLIACEES